MIAPDSRLFRIRARLARRLGLLAAAGLAVVAACAFAFAALALFTLSRMGAVFAVGDWLGALPWGVLAVVATWCAARISLLLHAPLAQPDGIRLPRRAAPDFYRLTDDISRRIGAARVERVWITGDMNALVMQRPRWGWIGPIETHLLIGLPLVHSVSRHQLAAVLAHEYAHLAIQRNGVGAIGALLRAWWMRVLDRVCEAFPAVERLSNRLLLRFYRDMVRLSRLEEFEADALAASLVGAGLLGETLIEVTLKEQFLRQDYWPKVMAQSSSRPRPSIRPYREMGLGVETGFLRPGSLNHAALSVEADDGMLHPTLQQRLRALRVPPCAARVDRPSAASHYFAPLLPSLAWVFDRAWWRETRKGWRSQYRVAARRR